MPRPTQWREDIPNMSDAALLVSVEDLINMAMGPDDQNTVNYKLVQMILHILARQMRMLETRVEVKIAEKPVVEDVRETKKKKKRRTSSASSTSPSPSPSGRKSIKSGREEDAQERTKSRKSQSKSPRGKDEDGYEQRSRDKTGDDYKDKEKTKYEADEPRKRVKDKERHESRSEPGSRVGGESEIPRGREKAKERVKDEETKVKGQGKAKGRRTSEDAEDETKKTGKYKEKVDSAKVKAKSARAPSESDLEDRKKTAKQKGGTGQKKRGKSEQGTPDISDADDQKEGPDKYAREKKSKDKSKAESRTPTSTADGAESEDEDQKMEDDDDDESTESKKNRKGKESKKYKTDTSPVSEPKRHKSETSATEPSKFKSEISALSALSEPKKYKSDTSALSPISEKKHREDDRGKKHKEEDEREKRLGKEMYKTDTKDRPAEERGESQEQAYRVEPDLLENPVNKYRRAELKERKKSDAGTFESINDTERYRRKHKETIEALREQFADQYIISESDEPMAVEKVTPERSKRKVPFEDKAESDDDWTKRNQKERLPKSKYKSDGDEPDKEDEPRQRQDDLTKEKKKIRQKDSRKVLGGFLYRKRNSAKDELEDGETKTRGRSKSAKQDTREVEEHATGGKERSKSARIDKSKFDEGERRDQTDKTGILKIKRGEFDDLEDDNRLTSKERKEMQDEPSTDSKGRKKRERTDSMGLEDDGGTPSKRRKTDKQDVQDRKLRTADTFDKTVRSSESIVSGTKRQKSAKRRDRIDSAKERQKAETSESEDYDYKADEGQPGKSDRERKSEKAESRERKKSAKRKDTTDTDGLQDQRSLATIDSAPLEEDYYEVDPKERKSTARGKDKTDKDKLQEQRSLETIDSADFEEDYKAESKERKKSAKQKDKTDKDADLEGDRRTESKERRKSAKQKDKTDKDTSGATDSEDLENQGDRADKDKSDKGRLQKQATTETVDPVDLEDEGYGVDSKERKKSAKQRDKTDKEESQKQRIPGTVDSAGVEDEDNRAESKESRKSGKQKDKTDKDKLKDQRSLETIDSADLEEDNRAELKERKKSGKKKDKTDRDAEFEGDDQGTKSIDRKKSAKEKDKTDRDVDLEGDDQGTKSIDRKKSAKQKDKTDKDGSQKQGTTGKVDLADIEDEGYGVDSKERKKSAKQKDKIDKDESQKQRILGTVDSAGVEDDDHRTESKERKKSAKEKDKTDKDTLQGRRAPDTIDSAELELDETAERIKSAKKKANAADKKRKSAERLETVDQDETSERKKAINETDTLDTKSSRPGKLGKGRTSSKTGISVKEEERGPKGEKVLVVEKGPTTRTDSRTGSIEVVTRSQFEELQSEVRDLKKKAGPLPMPAMPDNQKLRKELARGSATLGDTMQAMQVAARVEAAEKAIGRMAWLLTQLAAAGALPEDVAYQVENVTAEMEAAAAEIQAVKQQIGGVGGIGASAGSGMGTGRGTAVGMGAGKGAGAGAGAGAGGLGAGAAAAADAGVTGGPVNLGGWPLPLAGRKSVAIDPMTKDPRGPGVPSITSRASATSRLSKVGSLGTTWVTHNELDDALASLKEQLSKNLTNMTARATNAAEAASAIAKAVADKLDIALKLDMRISHLHSMVQDYSEQLSGFDLGLTTQMQSFQEQMVVMRNDMQQGLMQLASANNNAETAAVMELTERYDSLVSELDHTIHAHAGLTAFQNQLGDELKSLAECVETLREQKADLEEVKDGLRDKADNSRLAGLLTEGMFASSRSEMEGRLDCCYDKFRKQESVWMVALKDLTGIAEQKAEMMQLMAARDDAQQQLREIKERLGNLAIMLGEPKAALLTRQLSRNGSCGACLLPALQEPTEPAAGRPHALPAARPAPVGEEEPCAPPPCILQPYDNREHTCLRWAGGSHTLVTDAVRRVQAEPLERGIPTNKYAGFGTDGRMYLMENELAPCIPCLECNPKSIDIMAEKVPDKYKRRFENLPGEVVNVEDGAGDGGGMKQ